MLLNVLKYAHWWKKLDERSPSSTYQSGLNTKSRIIKVDWCKTNWNPKETIFKTQCATFLLLSYSKSLFVSSYLNLLLAVPVYNSKYESVPVSTILLYNP